jgi:hypothetical protein
LIGKRWRRDEPFPTYLKDGAEVALQDRQKIDQFFSASDTSPTECSYDIAAASTEGSGVLVRRLSVGKRRREDLRSVA